LVKSHNLLPKTYLFGLSGNPSACFTGFELFVKPAVQHMMQAKAVYPQVVKATFALLCAIATTAPDLLNPDGTTVAQL
jgi:molybdopterin biosynthesis enzyme